MPNENQTDPRKGLAPRFLPWVLGGVMLTVYWATLNHWVTLMNIGQVASASGWTWQPQVLNPLTYLASLPFHWVSAAKIPVAMNLFSAFCAAATLAVLARSVAILPHDRTDMERWREKSDFSFLTGWVAWIPPVAAVVFAGFQFGFWKCATSFTGESFELLWFAVILWQLLEYRLDEREERLFLAAFLYGAGLIDNWALVGFFPLFLMVLIWLRGLSFFNANFLLRTVFFWLAGLLLVLLLIVPLAAKFSGSYPVGIWAAIKYNLRIDWQIIRLLLEPDIRRNLALISLTSFLPAFVMSIRWSSGFGDSSRLGATLVNYFMHAVNAVLLGVLVWVTFDPAFSPSQLLSAAGMHVTALTIYYVVAVCIGYYSGYFLLIFGKPPVPNRRNSRPEPALPKEILWLCPIILAGAVASLAIGAGLLIYKNAADLRAVNDDSLQKFAQFSTQNLPAEGAILLCDSDDANVDMPFRAYAAQAALARDGRLEKFPVVDTHALPFPQYHDYLHQRFPHAWPQTVTTNDLRVLGPRRILTLLNELSQSNRLYYLNPSFGYYFEQFYQEPHGMVYAMKTVPKDSLLPPALDTNLIAENQAFWSQVMASSGPAIRRALHPPDLAQQGGAIGWLMAHLHLLPQPDPTALTVGTYYSKSLDFLGVQVQRAGDLDRAATLFGNAQTLNSNNVVATVNLAFNKTLHLGSPTTVDLSRVTADQFGNSRNWNEVLGANGPYDETSYCFDLGYWLMQAHLPRQAAVVFNRVHQLAPDNLASRLFLAEIYISNHQPELALEVLHEPLKRPMRFALTDFNSTELNELVAAIHFEKKEIPEGVALLEREMDRHPDNESLMLVSASTFNLLGLHTNALAAINRKLSHTPDEPNWLFGKGVVSLQAGAYDEAVTALSRFLELQTNQPAALYDRALAYLQSSRLDESRADFLRLQAAYTNNFQVAYGLGEIAWRQHQTNEAVRNYRLYLASAPTNSAEQKIVHERLTGLGGK